MPLYHTKMLLLYYIKVLLLYYGKANAKVRQNQRLKKVAQQLNKYLTFCRSWKKERSWNYEVLGSML